MIAYTRFNIDLTVAHPLGCVDIGAAGIGEGFEVRYPGRRIIVRKLSGDIGIRVGSPTAPVVDIDAGEKIEIGLSPNEDNFEAFYVVNTAQAGARLIGVVTSE